jgi:hypothetical protein
LAAALGWTALAADPDNPALKARELRGLGSEPLLTLRDHLEHIQRTRGIALPGARMRQ